MKYFPEAFLVNVNVETLERVNNSSRPTTLILPNFDIDKYSFFKENPLYETVKLCSDCFFDLNFGRPIFVFLVLEKNCFLV